WLRRSSTICIALLDLHQDAPDVDERVGLRLDLDPETRAERQEGWRAALEASALSSAAREAVAGDLAQRNQAGLGLALRAAAAWSGSGDGDVGAAVDARDREHLTLRLQRQ